jgi:hypothetical protein
MAEIWHPSWRRHEVVGVGAAIESVAEQAVVPLQTLPGGVAAMLCVCGDIPGSIGDLLTLHLNDGRFSLFWLPFPDPVAAT